MRASIHEALEWAAAALEGLRHDAAAQAQLELIADAMIGALRRDGKILACGNGGGLCTAMHFAEELTGRFHADRPPIAALALGDPAHLTCVANDYGFEEVLSRQIEALGRAGDVLAIFSTSGNSPNLVAAAKKAKDRGLTIVGLLGPGGGALRPLCTFALTPEAPDSARVQELHLLAMHVLVDAIEQEIAPGR